MHTCCVGNLWGSGAEHVHVDGRADADGRKVFTAAVQGTVGFSYGTVGFSLAFCSETLILRTDSFTRLQLSVR